MRLHFMLAVLVTAVNAAAMSEARDRPAPSPSRYGYTLEIDEPSLPAGVSVRVVRDDFGVRNFVSNASDKPLVINAIYSNERLASGTKLVGGKVYGWFPNGVPMEGKQHLKGWQAPFGEVKESILSLPLDPAKIHEGRKPGLDKTIPPGEPVNIAVEYDGKPYDIKATVIYRLNPAYDAKP